MKASAMHAEAASDGEPADPIAAVVHASPYGCYARLRDGPALAWDDRLRLWVASRAGVVESVLRAQGALRVRPAAEPMPRPIAGSPAGEVFGHLVRMNDGAAHEVHKPGLQRALVGLDLQVAYACALEVAQGAVAHMPLSDALFAVPVRAVARLLGFSDEALPEVDRWMRDFVACLSPLAAADQLEDAGVAAAALMARIEALVAGTVPRRATLLAAVMAETGGDTGACVSRALLANLVGLLSQTCDATAGLLGNSLVAMARDPGLREVARMAAGRLSIVEETARHDPSVHNTRRFAVEPCDVAGVRLAAGDCVLLVLAAANRDPAFNPDPDTFSVARPWRRTLGFGHGSHACPGQALACVLAAAGLEALLAHGFDLEAVRERGWTYRPSVNARIPLFC